MCTRNLSHWNVMKSNQNLSKEEFAEMLTLIKRHAVTDMDQVATWKLDSDRGDVYICLSNAPVATDEEHHQDLSHLVN